MVVGMTMSPMMSVRIPLTPHITKRSTIEGETNSRVIVLAVLPRIGPVQRVLVGRVHCEVAGLHVVHVICSLVHEHVEQVPLLLLVIVPGRGSFVMRW